MTAQKNYNNHLYSLLICVWRPPVLAGLCCTKHCTFVWEKAVTVFPAISTHQRKQGKERAQSSRSLPQGSQSPDYNSSLKHQNLKNYFPDVFKGVGIKEKRKAERQLKTGAPSNNKMSRSQISVTLTSHPSPFRQPCLYRHENFDKSSPNLPAPIKMTVSSLLA